MAVLTESRPLVVALPWRWVHVAVAALAMVATLPGRTHGLGLITEPLLADFQLGRLAYAAINFWATLLGAVFCVPWGWLTDRLGVRAVLSATLLGLGAVVVAMSLLPGAAETTGPSVAVASLLFALVLLTRGLGQSALSVVSLALMGRAAGRHSGLTVGVYSLLTGLGFMAAYVAIRQVLLNWDVSWRLLWESIGWVLIGVAVPVWLVVRPTALAVSPTDRIAADAAGYTLGEALATPAFWVFGLATSFYGLIAAGISLFNQSILAERGFDRELFLTITALAPLVGLASNLATGGLAMRWSYGRLLMIAMLLLALALAVFPLVQTVAQVYAYAVTLGIAGGMVTTLFFGVWSRYYGQAHLGKIQGAAQMLTVFASALGPVLLAASQHWTDSYTPLFQGAAAVAGLLALAAWLTPSPRAPIFLRLTPDEVPHDAGHPDPLATAVRGAEERLRP